MNDFRFRGVHLGVCAFSIIAAALIVSRVPMSMSAQSSCPCSIWDTTAKPAVVDEPDSNPVELGVKFQAASNGYVTAIRFFKSTSNTGNHTGNLWSESGTWLGTVTFTNETASGWQEARFQRPIPITANTTYIASYFAPAGHYSYTSGALSAGGVTNGLLRALANSEGGNGVFRYATNGAFPDQNAQGSNYWVDVVFETAIAAQPVPADAGQWSRPLASPVVTVHAVLEPTGDVLVWDGHPVNGGESARVWSPMSGAFTEVPNLYTNLFCAGHASLADGRTLVVGGHSGVAGAIGVADANIFDPIARTWTRAAGMSAIRWYPTATGLPDGRLLVISGATTCQSCFAETPEVYDPATDTWTALANAKLNVPLYPYMFVLPDGRVLEAGADADPTPTRILDVARETWTVVDPAIVDGGSAAMYRPGKVIKSGSAYLRQPASPAVATTYVLDTSLSTVSWRPTAPMAMPRAHHNLTILPDGNVLATGGTRTLDGGDPSSAVYEAELWSASAETWTTMARMDVPRMYHSVALLLPDARVLVAGGGRDFGTAPAETSAEIFSPPYLFRGPRPAIASAPASIPYGGSFFVGTPDAAAIRSVSLLRLGSVTHSFNEDQRYLELGFKPAPGGLTITGPAHPNLAPPGFYMLFLVNTSGVPSVAAIVQAAPTSGGLPPAPGAAPAISGVAASATSDGSATVGWSTDIASTSRVDYGTAADGLTLTASAAGASTWHNVSIAGLTPGATYYYRVTSATAGGVSATWPAAASPAATFVVPQDPGATPAGQTIWDPAAIPAASAAVDAGSVELGVKFQSTIAGYVLGLRFYKDDGNVGTHQGTLWTASGTALASVTFANETALGWQEARFAQAVPIAANTTYVASYLAPAGHYSYSSAYFAAGPVTRGVLRALGDSESVNGVYRYATQAAFPDQTYNATNYWVDVVFDTLTSTIGSVQATATAAGTASVTWTTDSPSDSRVDYGTAANALTLSAIDAGVTSSHAVPLSGLAAGRTYYYRVSSTGAGGTSTWPAAGSPPASFVVPDFAIAGSPSAQTVRTGGAASYTVNETTMGGFASAVTFSVSNLPAGTTAAFSPSSVSGAGSTTLTIVTAPSTPAGSYGLTIAGTAAGGVTRTTAVSLTVTNDFAIAATPSAQSITAGTSASYVVNQTASAGYNSRVNFSVTGLPSGATASFSPSSVSGTGSTTLTIATTASVAAGTYALTVTGTSGTVTRQAAISLTVAPPPPFTLAVTPTSKTLKQGDHLDASVSLASVLPLTAPVTLAVSGVPAGMGAKLDATTILKPGSTKLRITTSTATPPGSYALTISGTNGSTTKTAVLTLQIVAK